MRMRLRIRPRSGYYNHLVVDVDVDVHDPCSVLKLKYQATGRQGKMPELFYGGISLDMNQPISFYNIPPGSIIETCSNPVWVAVVYAVFYELKERAGEDNKYLTLIKIYIKELLASKGGRQPPRFENFEEWVESLKKAPKDQRIKDDILRKHAEFMRMDPNLEDPLGAFVANQISSKMAGKQAATQSSLNSPSKTPKTTKKTQTWKYVPHEGTVVYALLVVLYRAIVTDPPRTVLPEEELKELAQLITTTDLFETGLGGFTGFSTMQGLIDKGFVIKHPDSTNYSLSPEGAHLAKACSDLCQGLQLAAEEAKLSVQAPRHLSITLVIPKLEPMSKRIQHMLSREGVACELRALQGRQFMWVFKTSDSERVLPYLIERRTVLDIYDHTDTSRPEAVKNNMMSCGLPNLGIIIESDMSKILKERQGANHKEISEGIERVIDNCLIQGIWITRTKGLRETVLSLTHITYWLQKKFSKEGIPKSFPQSLTWGTTVSNLHKITDCIVLRAGDFMAFVMDSEYRAELNYKFPNGGLIIVEGLKARYRSRNTKLHRALQTIVQNSADYNATLQALPADDIVSLEIISYWCACIQVQGWFIKLIDTPEETQRFIEKHKLSQQQNSIRDSSTAHAQPTSNGDDTMSELDESFDHSQDSNLDTSINSNNSFVDNLDSNTQDSTQDISQDSQHDYRSNNNNDLDNNTNNNSSTNPNNSNPSDTLQSTGLAASAPQRIDLTDEENEEDEQLRRIIEMSKREYEVQQSLLTGAATATTTAPTNPNTEVPTDLSYITDEEELIKQIEEHSKNNRPYVYHRTASTTIASTSSTDDLSASRSEFSREPPMKRARSMPLPTDKDEVKECEFCSAMYFSHACPCQAILFATGNHTSESSATHTTTGCSDTVHDLQADEHLARALQAESRIGPTHDVDTSADEAFARDLQSRLDGEIASHKNEKHDDEWLDKSYLESSTKDSPYVVASFQPHQTPRVTAAQSSPTKAAIQASSQAGTATPKSQPTAPPLISPLSAPSSYSSNHLDNHPGTPKNPRVSK